jgi:molybdopterin-guanine dinucleotide biosynthesis protein A
VTAAPPAPFAAVVLAGGAATRLSGRDKALLEIAGRSLLDRALDAVAAATETVVVGPRRLTEGGPVRWTREQPAGGGPAAGLLAGLSALTGSPLLVAVLAVDMPGVGATTFERLVAALGDAPSADGAVLVDDEGRRQPLCAAYRTATLVGRARTLDPHGLPMHRLLAGLALLEVPASGDEARDVDTWADLRALSHGDPGGTVA